MLAGTSGSHRWALLLVGGAFVAAVVWVLASVGPDRVLTAPVSAYVAFGVTVLIFVAWYRSVVTDYVAAGADWLQVGRSWVDLYDLAAITGSRGAGALIWLRFTDRAGRRVRASVLELRLEPLVWDLVHLGTRYSRATATVEMNDLARDELSDFPVSQGPLRWRRPGR